MTDSFDIVDKIKYKILHNIEQLTRICNNLRLLNSDIILVNGTFDFLHPGHLNLLYEAKKLGGLLIVLINSDDSIKKLKGEDRPIYDQSIRSFYLASLEYVDFVYVFSEERITPYFKIIKPKYWVKGSDYINCVDSSELAESKLYSVELKFIERNSFSSSDLIKNVTKNLTKQ
jgi:rfaE bifunctional protein nucleotidyltransferase chain/domain